MPDDDNRSAYDPETYRAAADEAQKACERAEYLLNDTDQKRLRRDRRCLYIGRLFEHAPLNLDHMKGLRTIAEADGRAELFADEFLLKHDGWSPIADGGWHKRGR